jgi:hypothetical protein
MSLLHSNKVKLNCVDLEVSDAPKILKEILVELNASVNCFRKWNAVIAK